ncbi:MAG: hypothetical protein R2831_01510 [Chitinophagaceae bacterium]
MERIEKLKQLLAKQANDCFLLHALGLEYAKINQVEESISYFKQVLQNDANYVGTYYHLAKMYALTGQNQMAIQTYEKGIEIATQQKNMHARNELQMALDEYLDY